MNFIFFFHSLKMFGKHFSTFNHTKLMVQIMAYPIKLFLTVRFLFETMGIYSAQSSQKCSLNGKNFVFFAFLIVIVVSSTGFFLFRAQTISEYVFSFYLIITGLSGTIAFLITIWNRANIFEIMEKLENFIEKRKYSISTIFNGKMTHLDFIL